MEKNYWKKNEKMMVKMKLLEWISAVHEKDSALKYCTLVYRSVVRSLHGAVSIHCINLYCSRQLEGGTLHHVSCVRS